MTKKVFLAADLGASSGRVLAGLYDGNTLALEEVNRFPNAMVPLRGSLYWNALSLFENIRDGLAAAAKKFGASVTSVGVDTWGVDYGLVDAEGRLLGLPRGYRDARTNGMQEEAGRRMPLETIYETTGIQFMFFNTIFQVLSEVVGNSAALRAASRLLFMPDLVNFWLSGVPANERTIASTSQLYNPRTKQIDAALLKAMGIPSHLFGPLVDPGTELGPLTAEMCEATGLKDCRVVAVGAHDTASAVAAVPASDGRFAYLSSGTWSLMGVESPTPVITPDSFKLNFTNEGGVCDTTRVLKNICGLWLIQECRRVWAEKGETLDYGQIATMAAAAKPFTAVIDPDDASFASPGDMPARIADYCRKTGQPVPDTKGQILRVAYESLAARYRLVFGMLEHLTGHRIDVLHVVGGGSQNKFLTPMTASSVDRPVIAGPVEATALGNIMVQMLASRDIGSLAEGRQLIKTSFPTETYQPQNAADWTAFAAKLAHLTAR